MADRLAGATWELTATEPGAAGDPAELARLPVTWTPAVVPGTVAAALDIAGGGAKGWAATAAGHLDAVDWWFRCRFTGAPGQWVLRFGGVATVADVWVNGHHRLHGENMFRPLEAVVDDLTGDDELILRCASLTAHLAGRRPRPRWKTALVADQRLRWARTSLLGRLQGWAATPPPVGPWRAVTCTPAGERRLVGRRVVARPDGPGGTVEVELALSGRVRAAAVVVGGQRAALAVDASDAGAVVSGTVRLPAVQRWWPHTHGPQPLYPAALEVDGETVELGQVGFRTVVADRADGAFTLVVNDQPIFARGAVWMPPDPVGLAADPAEVRHTLELAREANCNLVRVPGTGVYPDDSFWDACDQLGLLVWQDAMIAFTDPPDTPGFAAEVEAELGAVLDGLGGRPSPAVICGAQEVVEQAAMFSVPRSRWGFPLLEETIPALVADRLPGVAYLADNPIGGYEPSRTDEGVAHYFGVGGYRRPIDDAERAGVRFASECLAFATPAEPRTVEEAFGGPLPAGHDPEWKRAVHHDAGRSWDLEDMLGLYLADLFGEDPVALRYRDPQRALELRRATVVAIFERVLGDLRGPRTACAGAVVLALRDLRAGVGWGVVDALGRPKAPWWALRRTFAPSALLLADRGFAGLVADVVHDGAEPLDATVRVDLYVRGELRVDSAETAVSVPARATVSVELAPLFDAFLDLAWAYRFRPPAHDVVAVTLTGADGTELAHAVHLPGGPTRPFESDVGLSATVTGTDGRRAEVEVSCRRFAQWVVLDAPGWLAEDSWFHLPPGATRRVGLRRLGHGDGPPAGELHAFNAALRVRFGG